MKSLSSMREVVSKIQSMTDPDVDQLEPLVEEGLKSKKNCIERIQAVEKALGRYQEGSEE